MTKSQRLMILCLLLAVLCTSCTSKHGNFTSTTAPTITQPVTTNFVGSTDCTQAVPSLLDTSDSYCGEGISINKAANLLAAHLDLPKITGTHNPSVLYTGSCKRTDGWYLSFAVGENSPSKYSVLFHFDIAADGTKIIKIGMTEPDQVVWHTT